MFSLLRRSTRVRVPCVRLEPQGRARALRRRAQRGWYSATVTHVRGRGKHLECYVKWAGYSPEHSRWLPRRDVTDKALTAFRKERRRKQQRQSQRPQKERAWDKTPLLPQAVGTNQESPHGAPGQGIPCVHRTSALVAFARSEYRCTLHRCT